MRIITGSVGGRKLITPQNNDIRPTSEMAKEAMFSIINFDLPGAKVLDLFAGTGQLGIEALSRGAKEVTFVDKSNTSIKLVGENLKLTGLTNSRCVQTDSLAFLDSTSEKFDIVIIDPPYNQNLVEKALEKTVSVMNDNGIIICETEKKEDLPEEVGIYKKYKTYKYGKIKLTVYKMEANE